MRNSSPGLSWRWMSDLFINLSRAMLDFTSVPFICITQDLSPLRATAGS